MYAKKTNPKGPCVHCNSTKEHTHDHLRMVPDPEDKAKEFTTKKSGTVPMPIVQKRNEKMRAKEMKQQRLQQAAIIKKRKAMDDAARAQGRAARAQGRAALGQAQGNPPELNVVVEDAEAPPAEPAGQGTGESD